MTLKAPSSNRKEFEAPDTRKGTLDNLASRMGKGGERMNAASFAASVQGIMRSPEEQRRFTTSRLALRGLNTESDASLLDRQRDLRPEDLEQQRSAFEARTLQVRREGALLAVAKDPVADNDPEVQRYRAASIALSMSGLKGARVGKQLYQQASIQAAKNVQAMADQKWGAEIELDQRERATDDWADHLLAHRDQAQQDHPSLNPSQVKVKLAEARAGELAQAQIQAARLGQGGFRATPPAEEGAFEKALQDTYRDGLLSDTGPSGFIDGDALARHFTTNLDADRKFDGMPPDETIRARREAYVSATEYAAKVNKGIMEGHVQDAVSVLNPDRAEPGSIHSLKVDRAKVLASDSETFTGRMKIIGTTTPNGHMIAATSAARNAYLRAQLAWNTAFKNPRIAVARGWEATKGTADAVKHAGLGAFQVALGLATLIYTLHKISDDWAKEAAQGKGPRLNLEELATAMLDGLLFAKAWNNMKGMAEGLGSVKDAVVHGKGREKIDQKIGRVLQLKHGALQAVSEAMQTRGKDVQNALEGRALYMRHARQLLETGLEAAQASDPTARAECYAKLSGLRAQMERQLGEMAANPVGMGEALQCDPDLNPQAVWDRSCVIAGMMSGRNSVARGLLVQAGMWERDSAQSWAKANHGDQTNVFDLGASTEVDDNLDRGRLVAHVGEDHAIHLYAFDPEAAKTFIGGKVDSVTPPRHVEIPLAQLKDMIGRVESGKGIYEGVLPSETASLPDLKMAVTRNRATGAMPEIQLQVGVEVLSGGADELLAALNSVPKGAGPKTASLANPFADWLRTHTDAKNREELHVKLTEAASYVPWVESHLTENQRAALVKIADLDEQIGMRGLRSTNAHHAGRIAEINQVLAPSPRDPQSAAGLTMDPAFFAQRYIAPLVQIDKEHRERFHGGAIGAFEESKSALYRTASQSALEDLVASRTM